MDQSILTGEKIAAVDNRFKTAVEDKEFRWLPNPSSYGTKTASGRDWLQEQAAQPEIANFFLDAYFGKHQGSGNMDAASLSRHIDEEDIAAMNISTNAIGSHTSRDGPATGPVSPQYILKLINQNSQSTRGLLHQMEQAEHLATSGGERLASDTSTLTQQSDSFSAKSHISHNNRQTANATDPNSSSTSTSHLTESSIEQPSHVDEKYEHLYQFLLQKGLLKEFEEFEEFNQSKHSANQSIDEQPEAKILELERTIRLLTGSEIPITDQWMKANHLGDSFATHQLDFFDDLTLMGARNLLKRMAMVLDVQASDLFDVTKMIPAILSSQKLYKSFALDVHAALYHQQMPSSLNDPYDEKKLKRCLDMMRINLSKKLSG